MDKFLSIQNLSFAYKDQNVFTGLNLDLAQGQRLGISGSSGCGKSTFLKILAGFLNPPKGVIRLADQILCSPEICLEPEERQIGMIFQDLALFPHMSLAQNIAFGLQKLSKSEQKERVSEVLNLIGLSTLAHRKPHEISGGQAQRVALARAIAPSPRVLLLDEPFASLDRDTARTLIPQVADLLAKNNITAILVSHQSEDLELFCHEQIPFHSVIG